MSGFEFKKDMALKLVFQRADDPEPIGVLDFSGPEMTFSGRADESAKAFFDAVIKNQVGRNKHLEDLRCEAERELAAAKAELVTKTDELAAAWMVKDDLLAELAKVRQQRDEAQEEVCRMVSDADQSSNPESAKEVAERRGWDCFKDGGGA